MADDFGSAYVDLHVRTNKVPKETDAALHKLGRDAEHTLDEVGHDGGDSYVKGFAKEVERRGPELSDAVRRGLGRKKVKVTETLQYDRDNNLTRRWVKTVTEDIRDAFGDASGPGGPFNKAGQAAADAIGAGFNISGKSPLIALLVPLVGAIATLVIGAVQAISVLSAALAALPTLLASIGLQVGVVMLAFKGMGTAISGAFAAKNAQELQKAIEGLTPPAQKFVKSLLPLKTLFKDLQMVSQANFFNNFGADVFPKLNKILNRTLIDSFAALAGSMGTLFRQLALFFGSPTFVQFIKTVIPSTQRFLAQFGPNFIFFAKGLLDLAIAATPFLETLGKMLGGTLYQLGAFFTRVSKNPEFFKQMEESARNLLELFGAVVDFVGALMKSVNETGAGDRALKALADAFEQLAFFLASPVGQKAIEGITDAAIALTYVFVGFVDTIMAGFAALELMKNFFIDDFFPNLEKIGLGTVVIFAALGAGIVAFFKYIGAGLMDFFRLIWEFIKLEVDKLTGALQGIYHFFRDLGKNAYKTLKDAFHDVGSWLYEQGRKLVRGFIDGVLSMLGFLADVGHTIGSVVAKYLPHSPAEEGPLSGDGAPRERGKALVRDFGAGIKMASPDLQNITSNAVSNISFGRDSVRVTFEGAVPTEQQARTTGSAVGSGILDKLAARNTRLAVRTL